MTNIQLASNPNMSKKQSLAEAAATTHQITKFFSVEKKRNDNHDADHDNAAATVQVSREHHGSVSSGNPSHVTSSCSTGHPSSDATTSGDGRDASAATTRAVGRDTSAATTSAVGRPREEFGTLTDEDVADIDLSSSVGGRVARVVSVDLDSSTTRTASSKQPSLPPPPPPPPPSCEAGTIITSDSSARSTLSLTKPPPRPQPLLPPSPSSATGTTITSDSSSRSSVSLKKPPPPLPRTPLSPSTFKVKCRGKVYNVPRPVRVETEEEMLQNLETKMKLNEVMEDPTTTAEEKKKLLTLYRDIIIPLYKQWYATDSFKYNPSELKCDDAQGDSAGIYELFRILLPLVDEELDEIDIGIETATAKLRKFGMSFRCRTRTNPNQQPNKFVSKLMDRNDIRKVLPTSAIDAIMNLQLPGLVVHDDHIDEIKDLIAMQLAEGFWACSYHCLTRTILERLVELPNQAIRDAVAVPVFSTDVLDFFLCRPIPGIQGLLGWETLRCALAKIGSDYLRAKLEDHPDKFVKLNRFETLFGSSKPTKWIDCYERCPREDALETVTSTIDAILEDVDLDEINYDTEVEVCAKIRDALAPLQGENYNHYYEPITSVWGKNGKKKLEILLKTLPRDWLLWMERASFSCIKSEAEEWLSTVIDLESGIEVIRDNPQSCCLMKSYDGLRIIVSASHFTMFDPVSNSKTRTRAVQSFLTQLELMYQVGVIDKSNYEHIVEKERNILRSFLMRVHASGDGDDLSFHDEFTPVDDVLDSVVDVTPVDDVLEGGVRSACRRALSKEYFPRPKPNIMVVSRSLEIGYMEMLYLREVLGRQKTNAILVAHGFLWNGESMSPLELMYKCGGVPACGTFSASPCTTTIPDSEYSCIVMAGRYIPGHIFHKLFLCMTCHRRLPAREYEILSAKSPESLTNDEASRLEDLKSQRTAHNNRNRVNPTGGGPENKNNRSRNRTADRNRRKRKHDAVDSDDDGDDDDVDIIKKKTKSTSTSTSASASTSTSTSTTTVVTTKKKKKSGEVRARDTKKTRPQMALKAKMVEALRLYVPMTGLDEIWWNNIVALLDRILAVEGPKAKITLYYTQRDQRLVYHEPLYRAVATEAGLKRNGTKGTHYEVSDFVEGTKPSGETHETLHDRVMTLSNMEEPKPNDGDDDDDDDEQ